MTMPRPGAVVGPASLRRLAPYVTHLPVRRRACRLSNGRSPARRISGAQLQKSYRYRLRGKTSRLFETTRSMNRVPSRWSSSCWRARASNPSAWTTRSFPSRSWY